MNLLQKIYFLPFPLAGFLMINAQTISMEFPRLAGKTYDLVIFQGNMQKKISHGSIPANGRFMVSIKEKIPYTGMARLSVDGSEISMPVIGKDFMVSSKSAYLNENTIIYKNNDQASELYHLLKRQKQLTSAANPENGKKEYTKFIDSIQKLSTYPSKILQIRNIAEGKSYDNETENAKNITDYITNKIDWKTVYYSGYFSPLISEWVNAYIHVFKNSLTFSQDFLKIFENIEDKKIVTEFAERTAYFVAKEGKEHWLSLIAPKVTASGNIDKYEGALQSYLKAAVGSVAPDIVLIGKDGKAVVKSSELAKNYDKILVIFYLSECGPCAELMQRLPQYYEELEKRKIRIITISGDTDEAQFRTYSQHFPWKDNYRDNKGMTGMNFKNYLISGTPTLFVIDRQGRITLRTADLDEVFSNLNL